MVFRTETNKRRSPMNMIKNKDTTINTFRQAIAGVEAHFASTPSLALDGTPTTPKELVATLQVAIDSIDRAATAEKAFHDAVAAQHAAITTGKARLAALRGLVTNQLGSTEAVLGDFGFTARKRQVPTEATKAAAVAKRAATRTARHTMGKRQKSKVKGTVVEPAPAISPTTTKPT